jgi:hypothetical protein
MREKEWKTGEGRHSGEEKRGEKGARFSNKSSKTPQLSYRPIR